MMITARSNNIFQLPVSAKNTGHQADSVFQLSHAFGLEDIHFKHDPITGLKAIVAIHNTHRGPALGGTRCMFYNSENEAIIDVSRLARGMSYKSAFANLPFGGGKAVLMRPQHLQNPDAYFESYGNFLNTFKGRFITAVDIGTSVDDMDRIARRSNFVLSTSSSNGDPSFDTARGVLQGIKAAAKVCYQRADLDGIKVAIQGVGKVGFYLARLLHQQGAKLFVSDIDLTLAQHCAELFAAEIVSPEQIYSVNCDVFSPCALGSSINDNTLHLINARIICGSANNQLASNTVGDSLHQKQIFLVPDYVVNVGGLIHVVIESRTEVQTKIAEIYEAVIDLYQRSQLANQASYRIANQIAEDRLTQVKKTGNYSIALRGMS